MTVPAATAVPGATPISVADGWFDLWFAAFGGGDHGIWRSSSDSFRVPYVRVTERVAGVPLTVVRSATNVHTPRFDVLGAGVPPPDFGRELLRDLDASMLVLDHLAPGSRILRALAGVPAGRRWHQQLMARSPVVDCTTTFDDWWAGRGSHRKVWAREERRLVERHGAELEVITTADAAAAVLDEVLDVEASGWKGEQGTAIKQRPDTVRFYTGLVPWCAEQDTLRLFLLRLEGRIVAFQLDTLVDGVLSMLKIGYLDEYRKLSPGQVLQLQVLRHAFADPEVTTLDMLGGSLDPGPTKLRFASGVEELARVRIFAPTPGGALAWARHVAGPAARPVVDRQLERLRRMRASGGPHDRPPDGG